MPRSANAAGDLLERFAMEDEQAFDASPDLVTFHRLLLERFPALEDLPDDKVDDPGVSPWSITPEASDRCVGLLMTLNTPRKVFDDILALGKRFHLVLYDQQTGELRRL